jgi:hypothetical protein
VRGFLPARARQRPVLARSAPSHGARGLGEKAAEVVRAPLRMARSDQLQRRGGNWNFFSVQRRVGELCFIDGGSEEEDGGR